MLQRYLARGIKAASLGFYAVASLLIAQPSTVPPASKPVAFDAGAKQVFAARCVACHGGSNPQGGLDLTSADAILKGGKSGPSVTPGAAAKSLLMDKVVTGQMPPGKVKLKDSEMDSIRAWIDRGIDFKPVANAKVREQDARAVIQARCVACHGSLKKMGGLDLRTVASRLKGGKSGPALVPGKPEESLMYKRIVNGQMPPDAMAKDLAVELPTEAETEKIRAWIAAGAPEPEPIAIPEDAVVKASARNFWSFQPPKRPSVPAQFAATKNPIDAFLLAKLTAKGMKFAPEADRLSLLRRAFLDLTGLPPSKADIVAYMADKSPDAYDRIIDRLLASPHYGERWGQHWLDLAGYADSEGFGQDDGVRPFAWRYRDYVIRALNADKPYTQFLTEQIAGDELSDDWKAKTTNASQETIDRLAATGFLRTVPDPTNSNERGLIAERMNILADEVEVLTSSVLGLTVGCARCHNHKYDPIPQRDYYRLSAILQSAYDPYEWKTPNQREQPLALESEWKELAAHNAPYEKESKQVREEIAKLTAPYRKQVLDERLKSLPEAVRADLSAAMVTETAKRTDLQKYLIEKFKANIEVNDRELARQFPDLQGELQLLQRKLSELRGKMRPKPHVRILADNEQPSLPFLLRRGEAVGFGDPVDAGVPSVFAMPELQPYNPVPPFAGTSGKRLALAKWLTQPNHPLTARVAVNQMWMRHFGRGIVPTVANFGHSGSAPANQELLDWLATEFVANGWKMKAMHRLMMTSQAYKQSSHVDESVLKTDPENALVSRMPMRRMDADTLYDSLVTASGRLDPTPFGPASPVEVTADKEVIVKSSQAGFRRNIYVLHRRQTPVSLMDSFDQPPMTPNCTERRQSNVATQALHMMNGSMTWDLAQFMAGRVMDESDGDRSKMIENVYLRAYGRYPSAQETRNGIAAIEEFRREWPKKLESNNGAAPRGLTAQWMAVANYCHAILNSAEFSFID
jgi:mono/diheme cytochrome c family protein